MDETKFYINAALIEKMSPCAGRFALYKRVFGTGRVYLTKSNVRRAMEAYLDLSWLASRMSGAVYLEFGIGSKQDKAADDALKPIDEWQYGFDPTDVDPHTVDKVFDGFVKLARLVNESRQSGRRAR